MAETAHFTPAVLPDPDRLIAVAAPFHLEEGVCDERQGRGSGRQCWSVIDAKGSHVMGGYLDLGIANCMLLAVTAIYESGRRAGAATVLQERATKRGGA
jgi:hypothetical protein